MKIRKNTQNGFIALISVVIISAVLLCIAAAQSFRGYYDRFGIVNSEWKKRSSAAADSCVDMVTIRLMKDPPYIGEEDIPSGNNAMCHVGTIDRKDMMLTFEIQASYKKAYTNLAVSIDSRTFAIAAFEETN